MKKSYLILGIIGITLFATLVVAWAYDTDGGFNIWQQGTCIDNLGNHTDTCSQSGKVPRHLNEWYPVNGTNGTTICQKAAVNCLDYNALCQYGACVPINFTK
ncbi:MAG: hypothetical protein KKD18_01135 [Nanoarchaeota archaeon]|nr:hypothetical protein [Nanoarchaeota archaeon]MBU0976998.1 hypothetical protein [Nanoarchaeota archaeon]